MTVKTEIASPAKAFSTLGDALGSAAEKFQEGSAVARQSAEKAVKVTGNLFVEGVYQSAYWSSFGFVFSAVYLIELFPETSSLRRGLEKGATDAHSKVHERKTSLVETSIPVPQPKVRSVRKRRPAKRADAAADA